MAAKLVAHAAYTLTLSALGSLVAPLFAATILTALTGLTGFVALARAFSTELKVVQ